jgi:hypothetical protein
MDKDAKSLEECFWKLNTFLFLFCTDIEIKGFLLMVLKGSDDGVSHSELLCFWTLSIVRYSRN